MSLAEARRIAGELNVAWEEWLERYTDKRWPGVDSLLLRHRNGACIFLERADGGKITSCLIEPFKPSSCREWASGLHCVECQDGLDKYWGLKVDADGQLTGTEQKIREFESFIKPTASSDGTG